PLNAERSRRNICRRHHRREAANSEGRESTTVTPSIRADRMADLTKLNRFLREAKELLPDAVVLRRRIHAKPELGLDLPLTTEAVLDGLKGLDVEIARGTSTSGLIV